MSDKNLGLYKKFKKIERADGQSGFGKKHYDCEYFVLDLTHDQYAKAALFAYAQACAKEYPILSSDLFKKAEKTR